jgi:hypothetical protein
LVTDVQFFWYLDSILFSEEKWRFVRILWSMQVDFQFQTLFSYRTNNSKFESLLLKFVLNTLIIVFIVNSRQITVIFHDLSHKHLN